MAGASSKAQSERRTLVWVDESAFYPLPAVVRTWAPRGETLILDALLTREPTDEFLSLGVPAS